MATGFLSPIGLILQAFSDQGVVGSGYKINTYVAGSSTPVVTYTDSTLAVQNSNPIVMGSNGRFQGVSVWAPSGTLIKMVLTDPNGVVISGGTIDNLPLINDINNTYPQTPAEAAAGITPTNTLIPSHTAIGYAIVDRYGTNTTPGTTDMSTPTQTAVNLALATSGSGKNGIPVKFLANPYLFVTPPTFGGVTTAELPIDISGQGLGTQIINGATATKPTFKMDGKNGWYLHDMLLTGTSSKPNDGISVNGGGGTTIRWRIERITTMMAGRGIVCSSTNTGAIKDWKNWPDNPPALVVAQAVTVTDIDHGLYLTGGYCHDISIENSDALSSTGYKAGACGIRCDATGPNYGIRIIGALAQSEDLTTDTTNCSIYLTNCDGAQIIGPYFEGATIRLNTCSQTLISGAGNGGVGGKVLMSNNSINNILVGVFARYLDINDSTCVNNTMMGCFWSDVTTPVSDAAAPNNRYINNKTGAASAYQGPDRGGTPWTTVTYSASMTPDMSNGRLHNIVPNNNTAFIVNEPSHPIDGDTAVIKIRNATGGALGAITWGAQMRMVSTTQPANGFSIIRTITHDKSYGSGVLWIQTGADVTVAN